MIILKKTFGQQFPTARWPTMCIKDIIFLLVRPLWAIPGEILLSSHGEDRSVENPEGHFFIIQRSILTPRHSDLKDIMTLMFQTQWIMGSLVLGEGIASIYYSFYSWLNHLVGHVRASPWQSTRFGLLWRPFFPFSISTVLWTRTETELCRK